MGKRKYVRERYALDISQYAGLAGMLGKPPIIKIVDELKGIKRQLTAMANQQHLNVEVADATKFEQSIRALLVVSEASKNRVGDSENGST